uniref:PB1-like domain-containing protein n=1 Tax=Chenopodium quinoa TaxID=63459 RepID=A0A803L2T9_CHEQI
MSNNSLFENVSLRYWHGGNFKIVGNGELVYMCGKGRTFQVSPDELCYWELLELGTKCGDYINIVALYYLVPGKSLADGLRKIAGDAEVLEMGEIVMKHRSIDVYVLHSDKEPQVSVENPSTSISQSSSEHITTPISKNIPHPKPTKPKKLTPKKGPQSLKLGPPRRSPRKHMVSNVTTSSSLAGPTLTKKVGSKASSSAHADKNTLTQPSNPISNLEPPQQTLNQEPANPSHVCGENTNSFLEYDWEDNRIESPLTLKELCGFSTDDEDELDPEFVPDEEDEEEGIDVELEVEDDDFEVDEGLDRVDLVTDESDNSVQHHSTIAQPSQLGRGGRVIYSGRGATGGVRGGATSGARGGAVRGTRGGTGRGRAGVGVLFSADGTPVLQVRPLLQGIEQGIRRHTYPHSQAKPLQCINNIHDTLGSDSVIL